MWLMRISSPWMQSGPQETLGDQVDGLGGSPGENNLPVTSGIDEFRQATARGFIEVRCLLAQCMHATMHVCVVLPVKTVRRFNDGQRSLCRSCRIEIDQRLAVNLPCQDGEVLPDLLNIEGSALPDTTPSFSCLCG